MGRESDTLRACEALIEKHSPRLLAAGGSQLDGATGGDILARLGLSADYIRRVFHVPKRRRHTIWEALTPMVLRDFKRSTLAGYRPVVAACLESVAGTGGRLTRARLAGVCAPLGFRPTNARQFIYSTVGMTNPCAGRLRDLLGEMDEILNTTEK